MKLLKCKLCAGEIDIIGNEKSINKKIKCQKCGFNNIELESKLPEVLIIRKRKFNHD